MAKRDNDQTAEEASARYSLRTRTPQKPAVVEVPAPRTTPRKRGRGNAATPHSSKRAAASAAAGMVTPTKQTGRGRGRSRGRGRGGSRGGAAQGSCGNRAGLDSSGSEEDVGLSPDVAEMSSEDEEYSPAGGTEPLARGFRRNGPPALMLDRTARRMRELEERVGDMGLVTPVKRHLDLRRIPVHLTKHDAFRTEQLDEASRILQTVPVTRSSNDDRYELMKMSDALKMCGYELGVVDPATVPLDQIYRLLAWAVHAPGPQSPAHPVPELCEEARTLLLRVFASIGRRIREETKDMAAYHRRHVLRKLMQASATSPDGQETAGAMEDEDEAKSPRESAVHRRNPLRVPGPLVDIWKSPYKKAAGGEDGHESPVSDA
ncbi:hypothetical protein GGI02_003077 [Coemansia sp. RSA 2322]|nr:hypothetical protein GGI02_003077 [Coemansia sp. RSA 2322]